MNKVFIVDKDDRLGNSFVVKKRSGLYNLAKKPIFRDQFSLYRGIRMNFSGSDTKQVRRAYV